MKLVAAPCTPILPFPPLLEGWRYHENLLPRVPSERGSVVGGIPLRHSKGALALVRKPPRLMFRVREGSVVGGIPLRHSKREWDGVVGVKTSVSRFERGWYVLSAIFTSGPLRHSKREWGVGVGMEMELWRVPSVETIIV